MNALRLLALCLIFILTGCGGGDDASPSAEHHYLLIMETVSRQPEAIFVYETERDCIGAGSYRLAVSPDKYRGYACKET